MLHNHYLVIVVPARPGPTYSRLVWSSFTEAKQTDVLVLVAP